MCRQVKQSCKEIGQNISERLKLYIKAFSADDATSATTSISQARLLAPPSSKLYQTIKRYQPSMKWERLPFKLCRSQHFNENTGDKLQNMEIALRGMEMALTNTSSFPATLLAGEVKDGLIKIQEGVTLTIKRINNCLQPSVNPESDPDNASGCLQTLQEFPGKHQDLPFYFFLFCLKLLENISMAEPENDEDKKPESSLEEDKSWFSINWRSALGSKRMMPAIKLSLSLGLAVLFGSMYSKPNGYWSGLPVAISFAAAREATFKVANVKAQGTVIGTVYGVMGCFVFERFLPIRFLSLLPWFVFSSFLGKSRMYGQAGAISAAIGAVLILGRKNFGPPSEFAIARIVETFIGLSCSIMIELILQPTRGSTLAKLTLSRSFHALHECASLFGEKGGKAEIIRSQKKVKTHLIELKKFTEEAQAEPSFWFLPFNCSCYDKLFRSLSEMADLLQFSAHAIGFLGAQETDRLQSKKVLIEAEEDLKNLTESIASVAKSFEEIILLKSINALENALVENNVSWDIEVGKTKNPSFSRAENDTDKVLGSYLRREGEVEEVDKSDAVLGLGALGFCMERMVKEMREIEERIKELVQWENPSSHVDLHEISCKIRSLYK
ncbi:PREDICTED: uncharacterized protein LOC104816079 [Tarenaya hassleriana]|uniref:uncharacterized protein LOC104816079 n=1 Tax=Tarenaya hassleriana TaxID=28532 RepID=UPI00053C5502|nr:PREDICTED: uncharacterized protein LOC104816079 [Tarenaya hassleriana]